MSLGCTDLKGACVLMAVLLRMEEEFGFTESPVTIGACSDALVPDSLVGVDDDAIRIKMRVVGIGVISVAHTGYSVAKW